MTEPAAMTAPANRTVLVGAVAYTPNVVPIWEGIKDYFRGSAVEMDFVLFSNYERLVESLLSGWVDIAWNTNLAYVRAVGLSRGKVKALAMRDTDADFRTVFVKRAGSPIADLAGLVGQRIALGSKDSGQARILPTNFLAGAGITPDNATFVIFDSDVGKHGDTGRSELDALRAVLDDEADVAALGVTTWDQLRESGDVGVEPLWVSEPYSHCNFTVLDSFDEELAAAWVRHLMAMDWDDPQHRLILQMEGLRRWVEPNLPGYDSLFAAVEQQGIPLTW